MPKKYIILISVIFSLALISAIAVNVYAEDHELPPYELLQPLPGITQIDVTQPNAFANYINNIFKILIGIAGVLAVLMITIGGIQYMTTEAISAKGGAKSRIWSALIGFLLIISSVLILNIINPNLTRLDLLITPVGDIGGSIPEPEVIQASGGCTTEGNNAGYRQCGWALQTDQRQAPSTICSGLFGEGWLNTQNDLYCSETKPDPAYEGGVVLCCGTIQSP